VKLNKTLLATLLAALSLPAAADLTNLGGLTQDQFRKLSEDLGAAFSYKGVTPATSLGPWGFDLGVELTTTDMRNSDVFQAAGSGSVDRLFVPKVHINKGLWTGTDIGAFYGGSSEIGGSLWGLSLRQAFIEDTVTTPAFAGRISGTRTTDLGSLKVYTLAGDLVLSKRLTIVTPYVGAGIVRVESKATGFETVTSNEGRYFGGVNVNLGIINLAAEAERLGSNTSLSAKIGWRF
jgi:hypothetical protein